MSKTVDDLFEQAAELGDNDRALLAGLLLESIESESDPEVEIAWQEEVERRLSNLKNGEVTCVSWEKVKSELESKISSNH